MVYVRYFWQGIHQIYSHIQCINTVLANFREAVCFALCLVQIKAEACAWKCV